MDESVLSWRLVKFKKSKITDGHTDPHGYFLEMLALGTFIKTLGTFIKLWGLL